MKYFNDKNFPIYAIVLPGKDLQCNYYTTANSYVPVTCY